MSDAQRKQTLVEAGILTKVAGVAKAYSGVFKTSSNRSIGFSGCLLTGSFESPNCVVLLNNRAMISARRQFLDAFLGALGVAEILDYVEQTDAVTGAVRFAADSEVVDLS